MARIIDISPEITPELAVFPGDTPFSNPVVLDHAGGSAKGPSTGSAGISHFRLSAIHSTPHLGAHADAPIHYHPSGVGISERDLSFYFGPCQVIEVSLRPNERITPATLKSQKILAERVLFKTKSFSNFNQWRDDFNALSPDLIDFLAEQKVRLVGIDTPSVDLANDKVLATHLKIYQHDFANLEGLVLDHVDEGLYTLAAFPLKIRGGDASPVRAVLIEDH